MACGFTEAHLYTHESGRIFGTGLERPKHRGKLAAYAPAGGLIDRAQWPALLAKGAGDLTSSVKVILDQRNRPWCWSFAATQAAMMLGWLLYQRAMIFDPSLGPIITGVYGGNSIDDMLLKVQTSVGCVPCGDTGSDPVAGRLVLQQRHWNSNWKTDAAKHVITGWRECSAFEALVSGLLSGYPGVMGVDWQGGGHALACGLVSCQGGQYYVHGPNSWGLEFCDGWGSDPDRPGWYMLSEKQVDTAFSDDAFGAYVICAETADTAVDPAPVHQLAARAELVATA